MSAFRIRFVCLWLVVLLMGLAACDNDDDDDNDDDNDDDADDDDDDDNDDDNDTAADDDDDNDDGPPLAAELIDGGVPGESGVAIAVTADHVTHIAYERAGFLFLDHVDGDNVTRVRIAVRALRPRLAADGSGHLHLVYVENSSHALYYATDLTGAWSTTRVTENVDAAALAVTAAGVAHIAYINQARTALYYATNATGTFQRETIVFPGTGPFVFSAAIDLAPDQTPGVAYVAGSVSIDGPFLPFYHGAVGYATREARGWKREKLTPNNAAVAVSLDIDGDGYAHIAHVNFFGYSPYYWDYMGDFKYITNRTGSWVSRLIHAAPEGTAAVVVRADADGNPYVFCEGNGYWDYWTTGGEAKAGEVVADYATLDATFDDADALHVAAGLYRSGNVRHIVVDGTGSVETDVETVQPVYSGIAVARDRGGNLHTLYPYATVFNDAVGDAAGVKYAAATEDWQPETIDLGLRATGTGLGIDGSGNRHIAVDSAGIAYYGTDGGGDWAFAALGLRAVWPVLALDDADRPHVLYSEWEQDGPDFYYHLRHARKDGSGWVRTTVAENGAHADLVADAEGGLHAVYVDQVQRQVDYAAWNGATWDAEPIVSFDFEPESFPHVTVDATGAVHACVPAADHGATYYGVLYYATDAGGAWQTEAIMESDNVGTCDVAVAADGTVFVSYINYRYGGDLQLAQRAPGGEWSIASPQYAVGYVIDNLLAVDDDGRIHLFIFQDEALIHAVVR